MFGRKKPYNKDLFVFLDIDGVLNTTNSRDSICEVRNENVDALGLLKSKSEELGFSMKVVLSSTWRLGYDKAYDKCSPQVQLLISKLEGVGVSIFDKTPVYKDHTRDVEISRYLKGYELKNEDFAYVILDDDMSVFYKKNLESMCIYKVNQRTGLIAKDVDAILKQVKKQS